MARYLFAAFPVSGHINPGIPIARELIARGHDVRWYSTGRFRPAIERAGARFVPYRSAMEIDEERLDEQFPDRPAGGLAQLRHDVEHVFVEIVRGQMDDLTEELTREPFDVLVTDAASIVGKFMHEARGVPWAAYGVVPLIMPSIDTAPFGLALNPSSTAIGRLRNRILYWVSDAMIFRGANARHERIRAEFGLPRFGRTLFDAGRDADLYLQGCGPSFEYPRSDMPANIRFVGAAIPAAPAEWEPPSWWSELDGSRPVLLLTQGTINKDFDQLIRPAIRALAGENILVIVTTGSRPAGDVQIDPLPANVRVERFIPYTHLMPKIDILLTNGGYGTVQIALAHGKPVIAIGDTEEKPEIANRVQWSGAGIGLKVRVASERQIRDAVTTVLGVPRYRLRAEALAEEMSGLDAARTSADLLEDLAAAASRRRSATAAS